MDIKKSELLSAATKVNITSDKAEQLWSELEERSIQTVSKFDFSHVLYYFGALIVIMAMGWVLDVAWDHFGGGGILAIATSYILIFTIVGSIFWHRNGLKVPGGLFITIAVCLIPLAVYGFQRWTGWWVVEEPGHYKDFFSWVKGGWFVMELATVVGGCIALKFFRFPFLTAPICFTLWFMSMDITPLIFQPSEDYWKYRLWVSMAFGIALLIGSYLIDQRTREDFAFWGYLFGVVAFWNGLSFLDTTSEYKRLLYCLINIGLIVLSVLLQRTVFLIFGAIGIVVYLSSLFYRYFSESVLFPFVLSIIGVLVVLVGILYQKKHQQIESFILSLVPQRLSHWLPKSRK